MLARHCRHGFNMLNFLRLLVLITPLLGCSTSVANTALNVETLVRSSTAWNGAPYEGYPDGRPELTLLRINVPAYTTLPWHSHPAPNASYLLSGELLVETSDGSGQVRLKAGEGLAEIVDGVHRSRTGSQPAELLMFYAGSAGTPLTQAVRPREQMPQALHALLDSINQRLDLAEAVALTKWDTDQPVQAAPRERQVIDNARARAAQYGLSEQRVDDFFADQIEANKLLQYSVLARWHAEGSAPASPRMDLASEIRPRLDTLQSELLANLAALDRSRPAQCQRMKAKLIDQRKLSPPRNLALIRASARLCDSQP